MKNFQFIKKPIAKWLVLLVLLSIPSFSTLLQPGYFGMHDDLQIMRIYQMDLCFKDLQIPCRWIPDMGYGYGYPLFNYYPVIPYYLGEFIHALGFSLIWSVKIVFILSFLVSSISMFFLGKFLWGKLGGLISALFYLYAPYHAVDVYVRGAMSEGWSLAWAPAVFLFIAKVIQKQDFKNVTFLAVFSALFLMSHNPMSLIFTPIMGVWALIYLIQSRNFRSLPNLAIGAFWGLGLASFFTIPVLLESKLVHIETLFIGYFNYLAHFISLNQMFISSFWGYGGSIWGINDGMSFQIGWLHWGGLVLTLPLMIIFFKGQRIKSMILVFLFIVFWGSAFLMHPRSNPFWEKVTILQTLQFPWRILAVTIFSSSLAVGSFFALEMRKKLVILLASISIIGLFVLYQPYFKIERQISLTDQEKLSGALWDLQRTAGIFDYLPKTAEFPPGGPAPETIETVDGSIRVDNFKRGTNWLQAEINSTESATIKLPIFDYPEWKVYVDKKEISFDNQNDLGQPTFKIDGGSHIIFAKLYNTPVRIIANFISLLSIIILFFYIFKKWKKSI